MCGNVREGSIPIVLPKLQTRLGGFLAQQPSPQTHTVPSLRSTSSGVRTLHYLKGSIPNQKACAQFIADCHDAVSGGFADIPRGKADVATTAIGVSIGVGPTSVAQARAGTSAGCSASRDWASTAVWFAAMSEEEFGRYYADVQKKGGAALRNLLGS